jgi:hypothetical protein
MGLYRWNIYDAQLTNKLRPRSVHAPDDLLEAAYVLARSIARNRVSTSQDKWCCAYAMPTRMHNVDSLAIFLYQLDGKEELTPSLKNET